MVMWTYSGMQNVLVLDVFGDSISITGNKQASLDGTGNSTSAKRC